MSYCQAAIPPERAAIQHKTKMPHTHTEQQIFIPNLKKKSRKKAKTKQKNSLPEKMMKF